jgi:hypothetical protein
VTGKQMRKCDKIDFPVIKVRRYLEPGPIVLVTSAHSGVRNIMTGAGTRLSDSRHHSAA